MFHVVNLEKWERREHFKYYIEQLKCGYSITANLDVTVFKKSLENNNLKFYPSFIYCVTLINSIQMTIDKFDTMLTKKL